MHLLLPYAAASSEGGAEAIRTLQLPQLQRLLPLLVPGARLEPGDTALSLPHEHLLASYRGWEPVDGGLPFAAWAARADGLPVADTDPGWGLLTPTHWQVGAEQIVLLDPAQLQLGEDESRRLWQALSPLFESEGWTLHWGAPARWYVVHPSLVGLRSAALERVVGQAIDRWLPDRRSAATLRRLQSEAQMLLHTHPLNAEREARGALAVNSFWLSGTGRTQSLQPVADEPLVDERLRAPWLAGDWSAWREAWHALDAQRLPELVQRAQRGEAVSLTLCGELNAQRYDRVPLNTWQKLLRRWRSSDPLPLLETL